MPSSATPTLKQFATRLLDCEAARGRPANGDPSNAFRVCERLRRRLAELIGVAGVRALFSRAVVLGSEDVRWLSALHVKADGSLEGLDEVEADLPQDEIASGEVVLVAELLGLLVALIGATLTVRFIQDSWPNEAFDDLSFD